ncbi:MAG TPA: hypothetical protein VGI99_03075, partial [Gemmataceae bacterium]
MILLFPNADTLKLALAGSIVGHEVTLAPAALSTDAHGRFYVEPSIALSRTTAKNLDRIGVKGSKRHGSTSPEEVANWLQIVPLQKEAGTPVLASQAPVLFELESADDLPVLVSEMLRLGNDKQSLRWFEAEGASRVLLRVLGPPYYTLLRALDRTTAGAVRAYREAAPRVWVELGFSHPFATQIKAPDDRFLLLRSPRHWLFLDDAPFQDVYDILQFQVPQLPAGWNETSPPEKMTVSLKLAAGNAADVPELWVLRDNALAQLDEFVRDAEERLTQRLTFAIARDAQGNRLAVLRTRPSKLAPPILPLENAMGFKPFWKLPNLYLPAGKRLHPTLRRDAVRRLLADDPDQVVWLQPDGRGGFVPESVPDAAFRSLEDWVDYVIETERAPLAAWIEATRFDFEQFVCKDAGTPKPKPDAPDEEPVAREDEPRPAKPVAKAARGKPGPAPVPAAELIAAPEPPAASHWRIQREGLEEKFLAIEGPLDDPARRELWPQLAKANAGEGNPTEAAICWLNALWFGSAGAAVEDWVRAEYSSTSPVEAKEFDRKLNAKNPSVENTRAVVAGFLDLASRSPVPSWLPERLPAIQKYLEAHEAALPVRAVWLAGLQLARLAGADVLGLARVRDRVLQRLLEEGLRAERDLPIFLRYAGLKDAARLRLVRDKVAEIHRVVRRWLEQWIEKLPALERIAERREQEKKKIEQNFPYVDLLFAFALARLGEFEQAKRFKLDAWQAILIHGESQSTAAIANLFIVPAFSYRIDEAVQCRPHRGPFPSEILQPLDAIRKLEDERKRKDEAHKAAKPTGTQLMQDLKQELDHKHAEHANEQIRGRELEKGLLYLTREGASPGAIAFQREEAERAAAHVANLAAAIRDLETEIVGLQSRQADRKRAVPIRPRSTRTNGFHYWEALAVVDRLRQESRVLEPNEIPDPYRSIRETVPGGSKPHEADQYRELVCLTDILDPKILSEKIKRLYKLSLTLKSPKEWRCRVLHQALPLAPRVGEQFALELLNLIPEALQPGGIAIRNPPTGGEIAQIRGELVDRAIALACQFGQVECVERTIQNFIELVRGEVEELRFRLIAIAMAECLRSLKKHGMVDQIGKLLAQLEPVVAVSASRDDLKALRASRPDLWGWVLQTRLHFASARLILGRGGDARPILDEVRAELLKSWKEQLKEAGAKELVELTQAYFAAVGHCSSEEGIVRIKEFFDSVPAAAIPNKWTGAQTYSRFHLGLI